MFSRTAGLTRHVQIFGAHYIWVLKTNFQFLRCLGCLGVFNPFDLELKFQSLNLLRKGILLCMVCLFLCVIVSLLNFMSGLVITGSAVGTRVKCSISLVFVLQFHS